MNRGGRREPSFRDHADRQRFLETLAEDAKANEQSLVEQAAENALPVEAKTIRETLEGFLGGVFETVSAQFVDLVPAR